MTDTNTDTDTDNISKIMKNIEETTEKLIKEKGISNKEHLEKILQEKSDEFKTKVGRNMTYSEMRRMFG